MEKIMKGAVTFRRHVFSAYRSLFTRLAQGQRPEALFITCSDSRIVPSLITTADPGDLFIVRNVGNIVPPAAELSAEAAALEFALGPLDVKHIVVCGHSRCGAMDAVLSGVPEGQRHLSAWLRHAGPALTLLHQHHPQAPPEKQRELLSELNILVQLKHIKTHPLVAERLDQGRLSLHAWYFEIDQAQLFTYDPEEEEFVLLVDPDTGGAATRVS